MNRTVAKNMYFKVRNRISDRRRFPRNIWYPVSDSLSASTFSAPPDPGESEIRHVHTELSKSVYKTFLALLSFILFTIVALSSPDTALIVAGQGLKLPFVQTEVSYLLFLILAPLIILVLSIYMHLHFRGAIELSTLRDSLKHPFFFNQRAALGRVITFLIFYLLAPMVICFAAFKALVTSTGPWLMSGAFITLSLHMIFFIRNTGDSNRGRKNFFPWIILNAGLMISLFVLFVSTFKLFNPIQFTPLFGQIHDRFLTRTLDLTNGNLNNMNLRNLDLHRALLVSANFIGADLRGTDLYCSNATSADLSNARFDTQSELLGAQLSGAILRGTQFNGTLLRFSQLWGVREFSPSGELTLVIGPDSPPNSEQINEKLKELCANTTLKLQLMFNGYAPWARQVFTTCPDRQTLIPLTSIEDGRLLEPSEQDCTKPEYITQFLRRYRM